MALWRVVRNPFPQPPPQHDCAAVVESPARKNAGGKVAQHSSVEGTGDVATRNAKREGKRERVGRNFMMDDVRGILSVEEGLGG
jgi:hypothetical protein